MKKIATLSPSGTDQIEQRIYLYPGGLWAANMPATITTVLGSCVSVCLWDPTAGLGGINHFILPRGGSAASGRYGNHALPLLLQRVIALGLHKEKLVAGVFGGASVLAAEADAAKLGSRNVAEAMEFLRRESIDVVLQDVLGREPRKLTFRPASGTATVRSL